MIDGYELDGNDGVNDSNALGIDEGSVLGMSLKSWFGNRITIGANHDIVDSDSP